MAHYLPQGVIPAVLLPFSDNLGIDEPAFRKHLRDVAETPGISTITINAHSTEVASCSFEEQRRVLPIARDEIGDRVPLVNGIWADGSMGAARIAGMATAGGASTLLVFPPAPFTLGQSPAMVLEHFRRIADASDLPIIVFQCCCGSATRSRRSAPSRTGAETCSSTDATYVSCRVCRARSMR